MAEQLTPQERLQPALLDRLTDDEPDKTAGAARASRAVEGAAAPGGAARSRVAVQRDAGSNADRTWHGCRTCVAPSSISVCPRSRVRPASSLDVTDLERTIRQAILDFEPRILPATLEVKALVESSGLDHHNVIGVRDPRPALGAARAAGVPAPHRDRPRNGQRSRSRIWRSRERLMDPRLLQYYNLELQHLREMGAEFAQQFPKIAARLGMNGLEVTDPYVERLLEGVGFLAARVQLKLDAEFPRFTQALLEIVYPALPGADAVDAGGAVRRRIRTSRISPRLHGAARQHDARQSGARRRDGVRIPHGARRDAVAAGDRVGQLFLVRARPAADHAAGRAADQRRRAHRLRTTAGLKFSQTAIDRLTFYLAGRDDVANRLYELCLATGWGCWCCPPEAARRGYELLPAATIQPVGFADDEALLPVTLRSFQGYRLLQEYFSFPQRFRFFELTGSRRRCSADRRERARDRDPLRPWRPDTRERRRRLELRAVLHAGDQPVPEARRSHPRHREHVRVSRGAGPDAAAGLRGLRGDERGRARRSAPTASRSFCRSTPRTARRGSTQHAAYFTTRREPRLVSASAEAPRPAIELHRAARCSSRSSIAAQAPFSGDLRQLSIQTLCTNRDLVAADAGRHRQERLHARRRRAGGADSRGRRPEPAVRAAGRRRRGVARHQPSVAELPVARELAPSRKERRRCAICSSSMRRAATAAPGGRSRASGPCA